MSRKSNYRRERIVIFQSTSDANEFVLRLWCNSGINIFKVYTMPKTVLIQNLSNHKSAIAISLLMILISGCTQETQNKLGRAVQNWTGTNGILDIYAGDKLVNRFIGIDKLSTAVATQGNAPRPYRFGYGIFDANLNLIADPGEKKVYFEFSDYSTSYIFYENPNSAKN